MVDHPITTSPDRGTRRASPIGARPRPVPLGSSWRHSVRSTGSDSTCVDVAVREDQVGVRDSKDPDGPQLWFSFAEWRVFLDGVSDGEFELPQPGHGALSRDLSSAIE